MTSSVGEGEVPNLAGLIKMGSTGRVFMVPPRFSIPFGTRDCRCFNIKTASSLQL